MPDKPRPNPPKGKGFTLRSLPEEPSPVFGSDEPEFSPAREPFENLGELPHGYGVDTIFLIAQEPHWLFTYWDIDIARHPGGAAFLRYYGSEGRLEGEIEVPFETRNWYVPVKDAGAEYFVEIGFYRGENWNLIARSVTVMTPPEGLAVSEAFDFATVPFHLSFQRMLDHLESARHSGEDLLSAVARLQHNGDFSALGSSNGADLLTNDQRQLLRALLGPEMIDDLARTGGSSRDIETRIRAYLESQLGSGESLSSVLENALFSGGEFSSAGAIASWDVAAISSWAASAIASWAGSSASHGGASSWGETSSWSLGESAGSSAETSGAGFTGASWPSTALASWQQAAASTSWSTGALSSSSLPFAGSSETVSALSSWLQGTQFSWLQGIQGSWAEAALSSWTSTEIASWLSAAATSSWSGGSETLSSFGKERDFYLHVNAEVIFYGGTDPRAKVTIQGEPVALSPEGTFRHHFVFPNSDYEIPIVAESPDGVERRSATLRLSRETGKIGFITDTPQPPLGPPMGEVKP